MNIKLNAVDYETWGIMQDRVLCSITSVDELKQHISNEWDQIDQVNIDNTVIMKQTNG